MILCYTSVDYLLFCVYNTVYRRIADVCVLTKFCFRIWFFGDLHQNAQINQFPLLSEHLSHHWRSFCIFVPKNYFGIVTKYTYYVVYCCLVFLIQFSIEIHIVSRFRYSVTTCHSTVFSRFVILMCRMLFFNWTNHCFWWITYLLNWKIEK